ncbi:MAG: hypothetical protein KDA69_02890 [Planctomycetaceae bacterium]|nr:hypothetical protein [Planctomycetaceae bacterium]
MTLAVDPIVFSSRFLHVLFAVLLLGGAMFNRFALLPAVKDLPEETRESFKERVAGIWRRLVMMGSGILFLTGMYNYLWVTNPQHDGDKLYGMLMGIKILLALVIFVMAAGLVGRSKGLEFLRKDAAKWLLVLILLGTAVTGIASFLKIRGVPDAPAAAEAAPAE